MWTRTWSVFANDISLNQPSTKINVSFFMTLFDSSLIHRRSQEMDLTFISNKYVQSYSSLVKWCSRIHQVFCSRSVTYKRSIFMTVHAQYKTPVATDVGDWENSPFKNSRQHHSWRNPPKSITW